MAKKKKVEVEEPQIETVEETIVVEEQLEKKSRKEPSKMIVDGWEIKDRMYFLTDNKSPLTYLIRGSNIFWFDEEKG